MDITCTMNDHVNVLNEYRLQPEALILISFEHTVYMQPNKWF